MLNLGGSSQESFLLRVSEGTTFNNLLLLERLPLNIRITRLEHGQYVKQERQNVRWRLAL